MRPLLASVVIVAAIGAAASAQRPAARSGVPTVLATRQVIVTQERLERFTEWITAVHDHEPGEDDAALERVASWSGDELRGLWADAQFLAALMRNLKLNHFEIPQRRETVAIVYKTVLLQRMRAMACAAAGRLLSADCAAIHAADSLDDQLREFAADAAADRARSGEDNYLLRRGAILHADAEMIATLLDQAKPGLTFEALAEAGTIEYPPEPGVQFEHHDYRTPSGKIELTGSAFVDAGLPRAPFASAEARPARGELRLLSPASKWLMNSSFGNDPKILKQLGEDQAFVHPDEARARGIANGARVRIGNPTGALTLRLCVSAEVPRGVILAYKSRWTANAAGDNVNALNPGNKADLAESCAVHSINVSMVPA